MKSNWHFYESATGIFSGRSFCGPEAFLAINTPSDSSAHEGQVDHLSQRVDLVTGTLVAYQPPPPAADDMRIWSWDASISRWVASPTIFALALKARASRSALLTACDWTQAPDAPMPILTRTVWLAYRNALRQVPQQPGFPSTILWPVAPA